MASAVASAQEERARKERGKETRTDDVAQVVQVRRADDGRRDAFLGQRPRDGDLRHRHAALVRDLLDAVHDVVRRAFLVPRDEPK